MERAIDQSTKALLKTQPAKKTMKAAKKVVMRHIDLSKTQMTVLGVVGQGALSGKINTKKVWKT